MWLATDIKEFEAIDELEKGASDRTLGVVAGAIIDSKLSDVLRRALGDDTPYSKKVRAEIFNPDGPLGSFGSRIGIAYLLGLLSEKGHTDLQTFKKIRNLFAHYAEHGTFKSQRIRDLCKNFLLVDERVSDQLIVRRNVGEDGIPEIEVAIDAAVIEIESKTMSIGLKKKDDDCSDPKWRFVSSSKLFCAVLDTYLRDPTALKAPIL